MKTRGAPTMTEPERYSFSRLTSFETCPYGWYQTYVEGKEGEGNAFSDYGTLLHSILERYATGLLRLDELYPTYANEFSSVGEFPSLKYAPNMRQSYFDAGAEYLKNFAGYDDYEVLACEETFELPIDDFIYNGIVDLLLKDAYGNLILIDYKSKSGFASVRERESYLRQPYSYSAWVEQRFGKKPDIIKFVMIRGTDFITTFDEKKYQATLQWIRDTVKQIRAAWSFPAKPNQWFCSALCDHRGYCEQKDEQYGTQDV